jgi:hypothetical protein
MPQDASLTISSTSDTSENAMIQNPRQIQMTKGGHTYIFRFMPGDEGTMMRVLAEKAQDESCKLDWLDGAVLASRVATGKVSFVVGEVE